MTNAYGATAVTDNPAKQDRYGSDIQGLRLAEQAVLAHTMRDRKLFGQILRHAFSSSAEHPEEGTGTVLRRESFPDRSVVEYEVRKGTGTFTGQARTANDKFRLPVICSRRCCDAIRHLQDPDAEIPWRDGREEPRRSPPTSRAVHR